MDGTGADFGLRLGTPVGLEALTKKDGEHFSEGKACVSYAPLANDDP